MTIRFATISAVALACLAVIAIFTIDGPLAASLQPHISAVRAFLSPAVTILEVAFGFPLSKFATGAAFIVAGIVTLAWRQQRTMASLLLYIGAAHLITRLLAGISKNIFLRARPQEALATEVWRDRFFIEGGSSFPSGHAAHFWALYFALAIAFPRLRVPALVLALFVAVSRVAVNDHYVSDILASGAIAGLVSGGLAWCFARLPGFRGRAQV